LPGSSRRYARATKRQHEWRRRAGRSVHRRGATRPLHRRAPCGPDAINTQFFEQRYEGASRNASWITLTSGHTFRLARKPLHRLFSTDLRVSLKVPPLEAREPSSHEPERARTAPPAWGWSGAWRSSSSWAGHQVEGQRRGRRKCAPYARGHRRINSSVRAESAKQIKRYLVTWTELCLNAGHRVASRLADGSVPHVKGELGKRSAVPQPSGHESLTDTSLRLP
jgi:hypothetical protein